MKNARALLAAGSLLTFAAFAPPAEASDPLSAWTISTLGSPAWGAGQAVASYTNNTGFVASSVATASNAIALDYSADGASWAKFTDMPAWRGVTAIGNFNGVWLAGASNATLFTSTDAKTWTQRAQGVIPSSNSSMPIQSFAYGGGKWMLVAGTGIYTSSDAITWKQTTGLHTGSAIAGAGITYANGLIIVAYSDINGASFIETSPDAVTWTVRSQATTMSQAAGFYDAVATGNGKVVAVGNHASLAVSTDGITYTHPTFPSDASLPEVNTRMSSVTYGPGGWVAVGVNTTGGATHTILFFSPDGTTWTRGRVPASDVTLSTVACNTVRCVALGNQGSNIVALTSGAYGTAAPTRGVVLTH